MISKNFNEDGFDCGKNCDCCVDVKTVKQSLTGLGAKSNAKLRTRKEVEDDELYGGGRSAMKSAMADYMDEKVQDGRF